jgi:hypothetical protein
VNTAFRGGRIGDHEYLAEVVRRRYGFERFMNSLCKGAVFPGNNGESPRQDE